MGNGEGFLRGGSGLRRSEGERDKRNTRRRKDAVVNEDEDAER